MTTPTSTKDSKSPRVLVRSDARVSNVVNMIYTFSHDLSSVKVVGLSF